MLRVAGEIHYSCATGSSYYNRIPAHVRYAVQDMQETRGNARNPVISKIATGYCAYNRMLTTEPVICGDSFLGEGIAEAYLSIYGDKGDAPVQKLNPASHIVMPIQSLIL